MKKNKATIILSFLIIVSVAGNVFLGIQYFITSNSFIVIDTPNANSRDTYFNIHNISKAHEISKGKEVKIGILDWGFGFLEHEGLYSGGKDFTNNHDNFNNISEHGYWMANVLKEIAPDCEIYALGTYIPNNENSWVDAMVEAIEWAIDNNIDILTLSHQQLSEDNRIRFDEAVNKAVTNNIVTTFIHYDNPNNILPFGLFENKSNYAREPDVNIFHYDYNTLFLNDYLEYEQAGYNANNTDLYWSISSTSPVTAGFVAILKSVNIDLTPAEYKKILAQTSYQMYYDGEYVEHVVNIGKALDYLIAEYSK